MPLRSPQTSAPASRGALVRLAGLGAAGVLATFVAAPLAHADDTATPTDTTGATPSTTPPTDGTAPGTSTDPAPTDSGLASSSGTGTAAPSDSSSGSAPASSSSPAHSGNAPRSADPSAKPGSAKPQLTIEPQYGAQKIRVRVALDPSDTFAPGTSLAGSVIQAVETGPAVPSDATPNDCTTDAAGDCLFTGPGFYIALPGDTVTFTQLTPPDGPGVLIDGPNQVGPCVTNGVPGYPACPGSVTTDARTLAARPTVVTPDPSSGYPLVTFVDPAAPPIANDDTLTVHTGHSADVSVLANDVVYGLPASITAVTQPAHGHAVIVGDHVSYAPDAGYGGTDSFTYTLHTANGTDTATVAVRVIAPPIARDDQATTTAGDPGAPVVIPVLANDSANGGSPLVLSFADASHGDVTFVGSNELRYTPRGDFAGIDSFQYTITTPNGSSTATVRIVVVAPLGVAGLAATGVPADQLGTVAGLLLLSGGWATYAGRRNRTRRAH